MNKNGKLLTDFCTFNNMVIGGSIFQHKDIHKVTRWFPDHGCIGQKFRRSL